MLEMFITVCLIALAILTAFAVKITHMIIDYRELSEQFNVQQIKLVELEEMDMK